MRILNLVLLAVSLVLALGAGAAGAIEVRMSVRDLAPLPSGEYLVASGSDITIDVFLDATGPLTLLGLFLESPASAMTYCGACSAALPIIYPGYATNGAQPSYILYAPAGGGSASTIMYPQQTPNWLNFPPRPGFEQVGVNYAEPAFAQTQATGNNIWIASLVYNVVDDALIELKESPGNEVCICLPGHDVRDSIEITIPEPTTAVLLALGLLGVAVGAGRRPGI